MAWQPGQEEMQRELARMASNKSNLMKSELIIPYARKVTLAALSIASLVNMILVICGIIYPVPQWNASGGLFEIRAELNASLARRSIPMHEQYEPGDIYLHPRGRHDIFTSVAQVVQQWDANCGCFRSSTSTVVVTQRATKTLRPTITLPSPQSGPTSIVDPETNTTVPVASGLNTTARVVSGSFAGLWLGVLGGCLQKRSGLLVCTSSSFAPDYGRLYAEASLNSNVTQQLPGGAGGSAIGLLVSIISFVLTAAFFLFALSPAFLAFGPQNYAGHVDMRHTYFITFATGMGTVACFSVLGSTVSIRNAFGGSGEAVEAWDTTKTLHAKYGSAFNLLYATLVISGAVLITGLSLIAMDFRKPWWFRQIQQGELWAAQNADIAPLPGPAMMPIPATPATTHWTASQFGTPSAVAGFR